MDNEPAESLLIFLTEAKPMNQANLQHFLDHQYIPFSKKQCIQRILLIWLLSLVPVFVGTHSAAWALVLAALNLIISVLFVFLMARDPQSRLQRYLCDGVTFLHLAVLLMLSAYRTITFKNGDNWILLLLLAAVLAADILFFFFLTLRNIADDKYRPDNDKFGSAVAPYVFGTAGFMASGWILHGQGQEAALTILAVCFMILSLMMGIGSLNLMKAYYSFRRIP